MSAALLSICTANHRTGITDLSPLQGMAQEHVRLIPKNITRGLNILRARKSLETIGIAWRQAWPAAELWQRYDKGKLKDPLAPEQ